jgi:hypothetical protein
MVHGLTVVHEEVEGLVDDADELSPATLATSWQLPGIKMDVVPGDIESAVVISLDSSYVQEAVTAEQWLTENPFAQIIQSLPRAQLRALQFSKHEGILLVGSVSIPRMTFSRLREMLIAAWDEYVAGGDPTADSAVVSDKIAELNNVIYVSTGRVLAVKISPCQKRAAGLKKKNLAAHLLARGYVVHDPFVCNQRQGVNLLVSSRDLSAIVSPEELREIWPCRYSVARRPTPRQSPPAAPYPVYIQMIFG